MLDLLIFIEKSISLLYGPGNTEWKYVDFVITIKVKVKPSFFSDKD